MNLEKKFQLKIKLDIEDKLEALKKVKDGEDIEAIKKATEELTEAFYAVSTKIYQAEAAQQGQGQDAGFDPNNMGGNAAHDDNVVDADFKVEEDK